MIIEGNKITADEGKVFRRKESGEIYGNEIYLGKSYYINGVKLDVPHDDIPEDFEEIINFDSDADIITAEEPPAMLLNFL